MVLHTHTPSQKATELKGYKVNGEKKKYLIEVNIVTWDMQFQMVLKFVQSSEVFRQWN